MPVCSKKTYIYIHLPTYHPSIPLARDCYKLHPQLCNSYSRCIFITQIKTILHPRNVDPAVSYHARPRARELRYVANNRLCVLLNYSSIPGSRSKAIPYHQPALYIHSRISILHRSHSIHTPVALRQLAYE